MNNRKKSILLILALGTISAGFGGYHYFKSSTSQTEEVNKEEKFRIQPPFPGKEKQFESFALTKRDTIFYTQDGSWIECNCPEIYSTEGKRIDGPVDLNFRQYNDAVDTYLSGIPMILKERELETGGMFEIRAYADGQAIQLGKDCSVKVHLTSNSIDTNYIYYQLDDETGEWEDIKQDSLRQNERKIKLKERIANWRNKRKIPFDKQQFVINYSSILDVYMGETKNFQVSDKMKKKFSAYNLDWVNLYSGSQVRWNGKPYPATLMVWEAISKNPFVKEKQGYIEFEKIKGDIYQTKVRPYRDTTIHYGKARLVMPIKTLIGKSADRWFSAYEENVLELEKLKQEEKMQAEVYRVFELATFGIYNVDRFLNQENSQVVKVDFKLERPKSPLPKKWIYVSG